jgi:peptidoglycan/xylan/chitin deacetylase (PgdA/CDA1 family)
MMRAGAGLAAGGLAGAGLGAAYWLCMSSYSQAFGEFPYRARTGRKVVALTFDDGPNEPYTSQLADFLGERGVRATFFQVGKAVLRYPEVTRRLVADGHVIGCHGFTHEFTNYLSRATLSRDVSAGMDALATAGVYPTLYRPPWLLRVPALRGVLRSHGLRVVSGEFCHALEVCQPSAEVIARRALAKARPGSILIFHDGYDGHEGNRASTVAAAKLVVDRLSAEGYNFATVDELLHPSVTQTATFPGNLIRSERVYRLLAVLLLSQRVERFVHAQSDGCRESPQGEPRGRRGTGGGSGRRGSVHARHGVRQHRDDDHDQHSRGNASLQWIMVAERPRDGSRSFRRQRVT